MTTSVRIRMYRPGFGDCFLVTLRNGSAEQHVLIDFGAHMHGEIGTMDKIMDNLEKTSASNLRLIVATHAHRDHISGFGKFASRFATFQIEEVWLPWTDDPHDKQAATLKKKHLALYDALEKHIQIAFKADPSSTVYMAALDALSNLRGNETARSELARGFGTGAKVRYLQAGETIDKVGSLAGLSAELLGPPRDASFLSRMNPPADQHFLTLPGDETAALRPFPNLEIRTGDPDYLAIQNEGQPLVTEQDLARLHELTQAPAGRLALVLDSVRNNTSLVILFRFHGKTMLFPGDAQWGNWQSWIGTDKARQLLGEVDFLKVAHHGSENATPVDVVHALRESGLAAMVPTQIKPFPTIPRMPLLKELEKHCEGHVAVRSDRISVKGAPKGPMPAPALPKGFSRGEVWIDYEF